MITVLIVGATLAGVYTLLKIVVWSRAEKTDIDEDNPYLDLNDSGRNSDGVDTETHKTVYMRKVKPVLDQILSFGGLVLLGPLYCMIALAVFLDDPGPVFFVQKRVGKNKHFFMLHKYRTMKMTTPHDVPTHMLSNPDQYITRTGAFLRKTSLDELPQIWDIFRGKMSIIGPRPALWNQSDLVSEREKYGANNLLPGLTGLAQIKGRDELEIEDKAKIDGVYTRFLHGGSFTAFKQDVSCFIGTIGNVIRRDGVVEGGTGTISGSAKVFDEIQDERAVNADAISIDDAGFVQYGFKKKFRIDTTVQKRVLITGEGSYIGRSFEYWVKKHYPNITVDTVDMRGNAWRNFDFTPYDTVFHVAGIAHSDVGRVTESEKQQYYTINADLAVETATVAKQHGVHQFIFMSSMIVYGDSAPYGKKRIIDEYTIPSPVNFYGESKWRGDVAVRKLGSKKFKVAVLRPPMIYGRGSKGNYPTLAKIAKTFPIFPDIKNQRSMLYIDNLCEFVSLLVMSAEGGIFFPQNREYGNTSEVVREIREVSGSQIHMMKMLNPAVVVAGKIPGKISCLVHKAFGNSVYTQQLSQYEGLDYQIVDLKTSIKWTEGFDEVSDENEKSEKRKSVLIVTSVASMIEQFNIPNIKLLIDLGYDVDVATNFVSGSTCTDEKIQELLDVLGGLKVDCYQIDFHRKAVDLRSGVRAFKQLENVLVGNAIPVNRVQYHYNNGEYTFIHSHSPIGGFIGRIAAKHHGMKTMYTAHGFHFFGGAPTRNWLIFYPIERMLSRITDILITINEEDYKRAKKKFYAKKIGYIPGVGIEVKKFVEVNIDRDKKRAELGIGHEHILLLSVGELNQNKNHTMVLKVLIEMKRTNFELFERIHYCIAGEGGERKSLESLAERGELKDHLHLLGYRNDIPELMAAADIFILPSRREGLNVSLMEAMASGKKVIVSDIRGNRDLIIEKKCLFKPNDVESLYASLKYVLQIEKGTPGEMYVDIDRFSLNNINKQMKKYYEEILKMEDD